RHTRESQHRITELAELVVSPTVGAAVCGEPAGVAETQRQAGELEVAAHGDGLGRVDERGVAELPEAVSSPAVGRAAGSEGAGVTASRRDCGERDRAGDGHWG